MKFTINLNEQTPKANDVILNETKKKEIQQFQVFAHSQPNTVGLAANQCLQDGKLYNENFFVLLSNGKAYINPTIKNDGNKTLYMEGCLSWPNKKIEANRYSNIELKYMDINGELQEEKFDGFLAQVIQHEVDHLNGVEEKIVDQHITREKIGRNDPCLCGSGKKYKKCCGNND